jgi:hypothetical protein
MKIVKAGKGEIGKALEFRRLIDQNFRGGASIEFIASESACFEQD